MNLHLKDINIPEKILKKDESIIRQQHIGTHLDCYNLSKVKLPSEIDVQVIDVRNIIAIDTEVLENITIKENSFVIFRTGYMENYGYASEKYFDSKGAPSLTNNLIDRLLEYNVKLIGIDLKGVQHGKNHVIIDKYVEEKGAYIIENICNLDKVSSEFKAELNWKQIEGATAIKIEINKK